MTALLKLRPGLPFGRCRKVTAANGRLVLFLLFLLAATRGFAQTGRWVGFEYGTPFGTGNRQFTCADNSCAFTYDQSQRILFFDTTASAWTDFDLGSSQTVHDLMADGELILVVTDQVAVAYDSRTSTPHVLSYEGTLLSTTWNQWSYGCGRKMAVVVTDAKIYVYDIDLGAWQEHAYGAPPTFSNPFYLVIREDFLIWIIPHPTLPYGNVCYSRRQHDFASRTVGTTSVVPALNMRLGFADVVSDGLDQWLLGYSALSNQFTVQALPRDAQMGETGFDAENKGPTYTYSAAYVVPADPPPFGRKQHRYSFDTRLGHWTYGSLTFDVNESGPGNGSLQGGTFVLAPVRDSQGGALEAQVYSGTQDGYLYYETGLVYDEAGLNAGGSLFWLGSDYAAQGYHLATGNTSSIALDHEHFSRMSEHQDFVSFSRYSQLVDRMTTYIYHGPTNSWTTEEMPTDTVLFHSHGGPRTFVMASAQTEIEVLMYSPVTNTHHKFTFPTWSLDWLAWSDYLAGVSDDGEGYLFEIDSGSLHSVGYEFDLNSMGGRVCVGRDGDQTLVGFSTLSGTWTSVATGENVRIGVTQEFVGWGATENTYLHYWAFNGFHDVWVPLIPEGSHHGWSQGARTILVVRSTHLYAFDPEGPLTTPEIFADGFESGDTSEWSRTVP